MKHLAMIIILLAITLPVSAQDAPTCDIETIRDGYSSRMADVETLDDLRLLRGDLDSEIAMCQGLQFAGDGSTNATVFRGVEIKPDTVYVVRLVTAGYASITKTETQGECNPGGLIMIITAGQASAGSEVIFDGRQGCTMLLQVSNITEAWTLEFIEQ